MGYGHTRRPGPAAISRRVRNAARRLEELERTQVAEPPAPLRFGAGAWPRRPADGLLVTLRGRVGSRAGSALDGLDVAGDRPAAGHGRATARASRHCSPSSPAGCPAEGRGAAAARPDGGAAHPGHRVRPPRPHRAATPTSDARPGRAPRRCRSLARPDRTAGTWTGRSGNCRWGSGAGSRWRCWSRTRRSCCCSTSPPTTSPAACDELEEALAPAGRDRRRQPRPLAAPSGWQGREVRLAPGPVTG